MLGRPRFFLSIRLVFSATNLGETGAAAVRVAPQCRSGISLIAARRQRKIREAWEKRWKSSPPRSTGRSGTSGARASSRSYGANGTESTPRHGQPAQRPSEHRPLAPRDSRRCRPRRRARARSHTPGRPRTLVLSPDAAMPGRDESRLLASVLTTALASEQEAPRRPSVRAVCGADT